MREEEPEQLIKSKGNKNFTIQKIKKGTRTKKTVEQHLSGASNELIEMFNIFNEKILEISSEIERYTTVSEILYKTSMNFVALTIQKRNNRLRLILRTINDELDDPKNISEKVPKRHGWGNMTRIIYLEPRMMRGKYDWEDITLLVEQAYNTTQ